MLNGEYGEGVQRAMKMLVTIGDAFDAEKMLPINRAHVALSGQEADLYFVEGMVKGGASCRISATTNPLFDFEHLKHMPIAEDDLNMSRRTVNAYRRVGAILSLSCMPYLWENIPIYGEHVAFSESSATPYVNSVIGARTSREAAQSALAAAITGRTPEYSFHLKENRRGTILVQVKAILKDEFDYSLLGHHVGERIGYGIPVFTGIPKKPTVEELTSLCAMLNVSGAVPMFHIVGVTPEAPTTKEAFRNLPPEDKLDVTEYELKQAHEKLCTTSGKIDLAMFGCPHHTFKQIKTIAKLLEGKKIHHDVSLWICTSIQAKVLAERMGYADSIRKAGGDVVADTCIDVPCWNSLKDKTGITDSPKCAYFRRFKDVMVARVPNCVEAAIRGEWK